MAQLGESRNIGSILSKSYVKHLQRMLNRQLKEGVLLDRSEAKERFNKETQKLGRDPALLPLSKRLGSFSRQHPISAVEYADMINAIRDDISVLLQALSSIDDSLEQDTESLTASIQSKSSLLSKLESRTHLLREISRSPIGGSVGISTAFTEQNVPRTFRNSSGYLESLFADPKTEQLFLSSQDAQVSAEGHYLGSGFRTKKLYKPARFIPIYDSQAPRGDENFDLVVPSDPIDPAFYKVYDSKFFVSKKDNLAPFKFVIECGAGERTINAIFIRSLALDKAYLKKLYYRSWQSSSQWTEIPLSSDSTPIVLGAQSKIVFDDILTDAFLLEIDVEDVDTRLHDNEDSTLSASWMKAGGRITNLSSSDVSRLSEPNLITTLLGDKRSDKSLRQLQEFTFYAEVAFGIVKPVTHSVFVSPRLGGSDRPIRRLRRIALKAHISRPVLDTTTNKISYKTESFKGWTSTEIPVGSIEFYIIHRHQTNLGRYVFERYPILPFGVQNPSDNSYLITHERLLPIALNTTTNVATCALQFYPATNKTPIIYRNYQAIPSSDWSVSVDQTTDPAKYHVDIKGWRDTDIFTVSYDVAQANLKIDPNNENVPSSWPSSMKFVNYAKDNAIVILDDLTTLTFIEDNDSIDELYLQIILRNNAHSNHLSPKVESYSIIADVDVG